MDLVYNILYKKPYVLSPIIGNEGEKLAKELFHSGLLRIDTGYYSNFAKFTDSKYNITIILSRKELFNQSKYSDKKSAYNLILDIYKYYNITIGKKKIEKIIEILKYQINNKLNIPDNIKLSLSRIIVQSAENIVIKWLLLKRVSVFITYSYSIGDVMDIKSWKISGDNSGMQSFNGKYTCVYVSSGGDPLSELQQQNNSSNNKKYSPLARMQIIAAQELAHFADIKRDKLKRAITRHSANLSCTKPNAITKKARLDAYNFANNLYYYLYPTDRKKSILGDMIKIEKKLQFYAKNKIINFDVLLLKIKLFFKKRLFFNFCNKNGFKFASIINKKHKYMAIYIDIMLRDMIANIQPLADVYQFEDKDQTEAIACAEALARVPQQVIKWGHIVTKDIMRDLYKIYYKQVITHLKNLYNNKS